MAMAATWAAAVRLRRLAPASRLARRLATSTNDTPEVALAVAGRENMLQGHLELSGEFRVTDLEELLDEEEVTLTIHGVRFIRQTEVTAGEAEDEAVELEALEKEVKEVLARAEWRVGAAAWVGLLGLSATLGAFAHLIWWRFDWDTMEPFTFMWTYSLLVAGFGYFVATGRDPSYREAREGREAAVFHKLAGRQGLNMAR